MDSAKSILRTDPELQIQITEVFLENLLRESIESFKIMSGSNLSDNFCSSIKSIEIIRKSSSHSQALPVYLIVKLLPVEPTRCEFVKKYHLFSKEILIYEKWFPELRIMVKKILQRRPGIFELSMMTLAVPQFVGGRVETMEFLHEEKWSRQCGDPSIFKYDFVAMVDMQKTHGFQLSADLLDDHHCRLVLEELAKLHALSWVYKKHHGISKLSDKFPYMADFLHAEPIEDNLSAQIQPVVNWAIQIIEDYFGIESEICKRASKLLKANHFKLLKLFLSKDGVKEIEIDKLLKIRNLKRDNPEPWLVGCHGDCWGKNLLFKYDYDEKKATTIPSEVSLLDLQIFQEACPTTDLAYFLFTSTSYSTRENYEDEFLDLYHKKFSKFCELLGNEPLEKFTLENLKCRYRRAKLYGLSLFLILFSLHEPDPTEPRSADDNVHGNVSGVDAIGDISIKSDPNCDWRERLLGIIQELCKDEIL